MICSVIVCVACWKNLNIDSSVGVICRIFLLLVGIISTSSESSDAIELASDSDSGGGGAEELLFLPLFIGRFPFFFSFFFTSFFSLLFTSFFAYGILWFGKILGILVIFGFMRANPL